MLDLHGLFRARTFGDREAGPLPLYAPDGVVQRLQAVEDFDREAILEVFGWRVLPSEDPYELGPWSLRSWPLPHFVPNVGVRLATDGLTVAYTGDTGPDPCLVDLAREADLLIAEATDRRQRPGAPPANPGPGMHLTAREAGEAAQAAGARRLLLTHFWPGKNRESARTEATEVFDGEVLLADEELRISL